jgi:hypothetical protein
MLSMSPKPSCSRLVAVFAAGLLCVASSSWSETAGQSSRAGHVVGHIDGIRFEGEQFHIWGWACQQGDKASIAIHLYADHAANDRPKGFFVLAGSANLPNEAAVDQLCQDHGGKHRFQIDVPNESLGTHRGEKIYIHGVRAAGGVENAAIAESGKWQFPNPPVFRTMPTTYPRLSGTYKSASQHPRVFTTQADLNDLATRINSAATFSAQSFGRLAARVTHDLASNIDWDATYSGCDIDIYLHAFSIESKGGYAGEIRGEEQLRVATNTRAGASAPAGAAIVASRLALYAALVNAGAIGPADAPTAGQATLLAKHILLAWANHGFRGQGGSFFRKTDQFCNASGKPVFPGALQISRGIIYTVHAQDLLQGLHALSPEEETQLNSFHGAMYDWIRDTRSEEVSLAMKSRHPDEVYSNQTANHLVALLAAARLLDDKPRFFAAPYGGDAAIPLSLPWTELFNYVMYGVSDTPLIRITPNSSEDPHQSSAAYTTEIVAPGEINDRFRDVNPLQGIGYPVYTLEHLYSSAEIMKIAGLDAYAYRGFRQQSIEMATQYYACYAKHSGFYKTVTAENAHACADYRQYVGKVVNEVESVILIGAYRFPENPAITELERAARAQAAQQDALDAIRFGRWRD